MDMWAAYARPFDTHPSHAQALFERFHVVQHLNRGVDEVRRSEMLCIGRRERVYFKRIRFLPLKSPWNLTGRERDPLATPGRWNVRIVRA